MSARCILTGRVWTPGLREIDGQLGFILEGTTLRALVRIHPDYTPQDAIGLARPGALVRVEGPLSIRAQVYPEVGVPIAVGAESIELERDPNHQLRRELEGDGRG